VHPFHPRRDQQFLILKCRRIGGVQMLSLRDESGHPLFVPLEWTDRAPPSAESSATPLPILEVHCLLKLAEHIRSIEHKQEKEH
jgi:hypothetical protein